MKLGTKIGIIAIIITIISALVFVVKYQYDSIQKLKVIETSVLPFKQFEDNLVRSQSSYSTVENLEAIIKQQDINFNDIEKDLNLLDANIVAVNVSVANSSGKISSGISSSEVVKRENIPEEEEKDKFGYSKNEQWLVLTEPFSSGTSDVEVPIGKVGFASWEKNPWSLKLYPREYSSTVVLGMDADGRHYVYSKLVIESNGKKYSIPIRESRMVEKYPEDSLFLSPRLYLGFDGGITLNKEVEQEFFPSLNFNFLSYGKTKINPTWTFATVGLGYGINSEDALLAITPITYNVGNHLPMIQNLHIGPAIAMNLNGFDQFGIYFGAKVGL